MADGTTKRSTFSGAVRVEGLRDFARAIRAADRRFSKDLRLAHKETAEHVVQRAKVEAGRAGPQAARAATTLRSRGESLYSVVVFGSPKVPFAFGANFGAYHDRERNTARGSRLGWNQFPEWGGNQFTGGANDLFLYRSIRRASLDGSLEREYGQALDRLVQKLATG